MLWVGIPMHKEDMEVDNLASFLHAIIATMSISKCYLISEFAFIGSCYLPMCVHVYLYMLGANFLFIIQV